MLHAGCEGDSEVLREWDEAGYIAYDGRHVTINDSDTIRDIAG